MSDPRFFLTAAAFRKWLEKNHATTPELLIGFHHVDSGKPGITYREALDEALCFGWIDGLRKRYQPGSYTIRFAPRRRGSIWSVVNTRRFKELIQLGRVHEAGLRVFERRDNKKSKLYSYEVKRCKFAPANEKQFRANPTAWEFYRKQASWYQRVSCFWVTSAKKEETRLRRLATLIDDSQRGRKLKQLISTPKNPA